MILSSSKIFSLTRLSQNSARARMWLFLEEADTGFPLSLQLLLILLSGLGPFEEALCVPVEFKLSVDAKLFRLEDAALSELPSESLLPLLLDDTPWAAFVPLTVLSLMLMSVGFG